MNRHEQQSRKFLSSASLLSLLDNEQFLRALMSGIVSSAMDAIITVDAEQRILLFTEQMFRCSADSVIGEPPDRFIPARFRQAHPEHIRRFGQTQTTHRRRGELGNESDELPSFVRFPLEIGGPLQGQEISIGCLALMHDFV